MNGPWRMGGASALLAGFLRTPGEKSRPEYFFIISPSAYIYSLLLVIENSRLLPVGDVPHVAEVRAAAPGATVNTQHGLLWSISCDESCGNWTGRPRVSLLEWRSRGRERGSCIDTDVTHLCQMRSSSPSQLAANNDRCSGEGGAAQ